MGKYTGRDVVCPHGGAKVPYSLDTQDELLLTAADTELLSEMSIGTTATSFHFEPSSLCTWTSIRWQVRQGHTPTKYAFNETRQWCKDTHIVLFSKVGFVPRLNGDAKIVFHVLVLQQGKVNTAPHTVKGREIAENKWTQCLLSRKGIWIIKQMN